MSNRVVKNKVKKEDSRNPPIMIDVKFNEKYNSYANPQRKDSEKKKEVFFARMVDLFMLAMIHGFKTDFSKPLGKKTDIFKWSNFKEEDILLIKSICLLETNKNHDNGPDIINSKSEMVKIIQEFANGGFSDLMEKFEESPDLEANFMNLLVTELEE